MVTFKSSEAQQNFGMVMEHALADGDVVIERYGAPRVAIINFKRYQRLLDAERELLRLRLQQASAATSAQFAHLTDDEIDALIEEARDEVQRELAAG